MKALISVSDKRGVLDFAKALKDMGWDIIATGGTMKMLEEGGVPVIGISDITGFPEICGGRVKTLHPKVHGALLGRRDNEGDMAQLAENGIGLIDLVCVNLYPFEATIAKPDVTLADAIENIDIGGPSMLRSAAKNCKSVTVVCEPDDYATVLDEIRANGNTTEETRLRLSAKASPTQLSMTAISRHTCAVRQDYPRNCSLPSTGSGSSLRRESPPERQVLPHSGGIFIQRGHCASASGQRTVVQQYSGRQRRS